MRALLIYRAFRIAGHIIGSRLAATGKTFGSLPSFMMVRICRL